MLTKINKHFSFLEVKIHQIYISSTGPSAYPYRQTVPCDWALHRWGRMANPQSANGSCVAAPMSLVTTSPRRAPSGATIIESSSTGKETYRGWLVAIKRCHVHRPTKRSKAK